MRASKHCACRRRTTSLPWLTVLAAPGLPSRRTLRVGRPRPGGTAAVPRAKAAAPAPLGRGKQAEFTSLQYMRAPSARARAIGPVTSWGEEGSASPPPHPPTSRCCAVLSSFVSRPGAAAPRTPRPCGGLASSAICLIRYPPTAGGGAALSPPPCTPPRERECAYSIFHAWPRCVVQGTCRRTCVAAHACLS